MQTLQLRHTLRPAAFKLTADTAHHTDPAQMDHPSFTKAVCGRKQEDSYLQKTAFYVIIV